MTYPVTGAVYALNMNIPSFDANLAGFPRILDTRRVLWRMRGPRRVIAACLVDRPTGHELVVFFEDDEEAVIESQFDAVAVEGLIDRSETLKEILKRKGLIAIEAIKPTSEQDLAHPTALRSARQPTVAGA